MTDINDLLGGVKTSSNGSVGASFFAIGRLLEILEECFRSMQVCFDIISVFLRLLI